MIEQTNLLSPLDTKQLNEAVDLRLPFSLITRTIHDGDADYRLTWYLEPDDADDSWNAVRYNSWDTEPEGSDLVTDSTMDAFLTLLLNRVYVLSDDMDLTEGTYPLWFN